MSIALLLRRLHAQHHQTVFEAAAEHEECQPRSHRRTPCAAFAGAPRSKHFVHVLVSTGALLSLTARAAPAELPLTPATTEVSTRVWGIGLLPVDGTFREFSGTMAYSRPDFAQCDVTLSIQATSLAMADPERRDEFLSPDFLDAERFPALSYRGSCSGSDKIEGTLAMRGVSHALPLKLEHTDHRLTAEGDLDRRVWGMTAKPLMVGRTVRIRVIVRLP